MSILPISCDLGGVTYYLQCLLRLMHWTLSACIQLMNLKQSFWSVHTGRYLISP